MGNVSKFSLVEEASGWDNIFNDENKPIGGDASPTGKNQLETNAENKVGEERKIPGELENGNEGISNDKKLK